uniref:Putative secretory peptide-70 n=1 Tax=Pleurobrachia bachei TaxID=34499 RepID=M4H1W9_PLEBA|nr:putative secretory peptide-70 [Pleurobrachia bachei]|eukprot:sb/3472306/
MEKPWILILGIIALIILMVSADIPTEWSNTKEIKEQINDTFPVELQTGSKKVSINFYRHKVGIEKQKQGYKYSIRRCTGELWGFVLFPVIAIPDTEEKTWRITKSADGLQIHCNGLKVLDYNFYSSPTKDHRQNCVDLWSGESKGDLKLTNEDKGTKKIRGKNLFYLF